MPSPASEVRVRVPGKLNLHLGVGPLREDGFHGLITVFQAVAVYDVVTARAAPALSVRTSGGKGVPDGPGNLAWRAAALLAERTGRSPDVALEIAKAIPVAGGMAGGSADAAATLVACATLWDLDVDLVPLAAELGSDVAFPLLGGTALGTGRGEHLAPVECAARLDWVLVPAGFGISTAEAYRELDRLRRSPDPARPERLIAALAAGDLVAVAAELHNDLHAAALSLAPALQDALDAGRRAGALAGIVSGSGPTCALLCASPADAGRVAAHLGGAAFATHGPVPGAHVT